MYFKTHDKAIFPHPLFSDEEGAVAFAESINKEDVLTGYAFGLFPWYNNYPIFWWNTNPRCVLFPDQLKISKSMRPYFNQNKFSVSYNTAFLKVINACKNIKRPGQAGSWLNEDLIQIFTKLHKQNIVQSVEVWQDEKLVGGLYGIKLGKIFFGESMFSLKPNASKFGFISLVKKLQKEGIVLIDCQQETEHLKSLGARTIDKVTFWGYIKRNLLEILKEEPELQN